MRKSTELYKIKPDGRGSTKTVNASKLKKASGPFYRVRVVKVKSEVSRYVDEAIERVLEEGRTPDLKRSEDINSNERVEDDNIHRQVDEIIEMINQAGEKEYTGVRPKLGRGPRIRSGSNNEKRWGLSAQLLFSEEVG